MSLHQFLYQPDHHIVRHRVPQAQAQAHGHGARMVGSRILELMVVVSGAGSLALAVTALAVDAFAEPGLLLILGLVVGTILFSGYVLWLEVRWLCLGGEEPGNCDLLVLVAMGTVFLCLDIGAGYAVVMVGQLAPLSRLAAKMASAAGVLATGSALGMLWIRHHA